MKSHRSSHACGAHSIGEATPGTDFDYTCDDCMLPSNHVDLPPEALEYLDKKDNQKRNKARKKLTQNKPF